MSEQDNKPANRLDQLKLHTQNLAEEYREIFPKIDPALVYDLISRLSQDPKHDSPIYTLEVFTIEGLDSKIPRDHILQTTGTVPSVYDNSTHYVATHRLTLEILKKLNDIDYVLEVMGDYTGSDASRGPQHDKGEWKRVRDKSGTA